MTTGEIWVISEMFYPELTSTGYFLTGIAEGLGEHFPVSVLCGQPSYDARGTRAPVTEDRFGLRIRRCGATTLDKNRIMGKILNVLTISFSLFANALLRIPARARVIVVTTPPLLPFLIAVACALKGAKCILLIHDVHPNTLRVAGLIKDGSFIDRVLERMNRILYDRMDLIVVLGRAMHALTLQKLRGRHERVCVLPNWGEVGEIAVVPKESNGLIHSMGLRDKFVIEYAGNMGRTHALDDIVAAAELLSDDPRFHFLMIGNGAKRRWVEQAVSEKGLNNMTVISPLPRNERTTALGACDVSIIALKRGMAGVSVPSRMYNVMASGRAIVAVADEETELVKVVLEEGIGWHVPPGEPASLAETLRLICCSIHDVRRKGLRARALVERKYSMNHVIDGYVKLMDSLGEAGR